MLNDILHQPIRTKIITYIYSVKRASFSDIKMTLELTDGHMSTHIKSLMKSGYISNNKTFKTGKPLTTYTITIKGMKAFLSYIDELDCIVRFVKTV